MSEDEHIPASVHDDKFGNPQPNKVVPDESAIIPPPTANQQSIVAESAIQNMEAHHPHHVTHKKNWAEYILEFCMLFLAVFLGFVAENIREHSVEKERARQFAASLVHDLEKDTAMVQIDINQIRISISKIDSLARFLKNKKISEIGNKQLFAYTAIGGQYRPYTWSRATIDEIKSSGSLRYFDNDSIVMRISAYDALTKHMDADFNGDRERNDKLSEKKNRIVDKNYDLSVDKRLVYIYPDSIINGLLQNYGQQDMPLLTSDINEIKSMLNDYIDAKNELDTRGNHELPNVIAQASQLITLLQKEYYLKDE